MLRLDARAGWPEIFLIIAVLFLGYAVIKWDISTEASILLSVSLGLFTATGSARLSAEASRREHTVTMLLHVRTDQLLHDHISCIRKTFSTTPISKANLSDTSKDNGVYAALQILNFYEFLAKAIHNDDLDEKLVRETIENQFMHACKFCLEVIRDGLQKDTRNPKKTYSGILWLYRQWPGTPLL